MKFQFIHLSPSEPAESPSLQIFRQDMALDLDLLGTRVWSRDLWKALLDNLIL